MYSEIAANKRKTVVIMFFFVLLVVVIGLAAQYIFPDYPITIIALVFAVSYAFYSYFNASKMALAINGAHEVTQKEAPELYRIVENLAITEGMPTPKVYIIEDKALNAFASGRDPEHAVVAVTTGLLDVLEKPELEGVMAHELGHVKNYDIRVSMIAFALVTIIALISDILLRSLIWGGGSRRENNNPVLFAVGIAAIVLAPLAASLLKMSISRKREYLADATGAMTTRYPEGLANALKKIEKHGSVLKKQNSATAHLFFASPLNGKSFTKYFSTHPPIEDRIKKLNEMGTKL